MKRNKHINYVKKKKRIANKKMKLKALIEISQLNSQDTKGSLLVKDKSAKNKRKRALDNDTSASNDNMNNGESTRKKLRKDVQYLLNGQEKCIEEPPVFGVLTPEQQKIIKKLLEQRSKKRKGRPSLELLEPGEQADLITPAEKRVPLTTDDFQQFIRSSAHPIIGSRWAEFVNKQKVERRIFMVFEGVGFNEYLKNEAHLQSLSQFEARLEVATPLSYGASLINELAIVPMSTTQKKILIQEYGNVKSAVEAGEIYNAFRTMFTVVKASETKPKDQQKCQASAAEADKFSRKDLLLTPWEMLEENFPLPASGDYGQKFKDFVKTREEYSEVTPTSPMWSIDCEMCITTAGSELTRICIINEAHEIVYESLVKPPNRIVNYVTEFSGITKDLLCNVTITLEDVQAHIRSICPPDVILVGQSLNFDLIAMKWCGECSQSKAGGTTPSSPELGLINPNIMPGEEGVVLNKYLGPRFDVAIPQVRPDHIGHVFLKICDIPSSANHKMIHPYVIDTSIIYNLSGQRHRKSKLRVLTEEFLSERIQVGNDGHSPIEDALAAMKLVQLKLQHSLSWGNAVLGGPRSEDEVEISRALLKQREAAGNDCLALPSSSNDFPKIKHQFSTSLFSHFVKYDRKVLLIGKENILNEWGQYVNNSPVVETHPVQTNKLGVKVAKRFTPLNGISILHISLEEHSPQAAIVKADKLAKKLLKDAMPNTLYSILLAGRSDTPGNGLLFIHLVREHVPFATLPPPPS